MKKMSLAMLVTRAKSRVKYKAGLERVCEYILLRHSNREDGTVNDSKIVISDARVVVYEK